MLRWCLLLVVFGLNAPLQAKDLDSLKAFQCTDQSQKEYYNFLMDKSDEEKTKYGLLLLVSTGVTALGIELKYNESLPQQDFTAIYCQALGAIVEEDLGGTIRALSIDELLSFKNWINRAFIGD